MFPARIYFALVAKTNKDDFGPETDECELKISLFWSRTTCKTQFPPKILTTGFALPHMNGAVTSQLSRS